MNIIIVGAGKVGFNLAKSLSVKHNVAIIDKNIDALSRIQESIDILPIKGDSEDIKTYDSLKSQEIDLFIAVTNEDNVNLVSTIIASSILNIKQIFVRLQQDLNEEILSKKLNINKIIFPIKQASQGIVSLLKSPIANNVKTFKYTNHKLISIRISKEIDFSTLDFNKIIIVGIERNKNFLILKDNNIQLEKNDLLYIFGEEIEIRKICLKVENSFNIHNCVVFGADKLGVNIAKELVNHGCEVKLIDKDINLCRKADEELNGDVSVINAKYGTYDIFEEEKLNSADIFIAATKNDEINIVKSLEAKEFGIKKVVTINNELKHYNLMHSLGLIVVRGPKISAYNKIMEEINSTGVVIRKGFCGGKAYIFMRKIFPNSKLIGKKIKPLRINDVKICYIQDDQLHSFNEKITLKENDLIIAFSNIIYMEKIKSWIYEL